MSEPSGGWDRRRFLSGLGLLAVPAVLPAAAHASPYTTAPPGRGGSGRLVVLGTVLHFLDDPGDPGDEQAWEVFEDGALVVEDGLVSWVGLADALPAAYRGGAEVVDHRGRLIVPGFVDCHVHYSQVDSLASYGKHLLDWLDEYVYPVEARFGDRGHADVVAGFFLDRLLAAGTTTASVHPTLHPESVDAFFTEAHRRNLRMLCGKVLMDDPSHSPEFLLDASVEQAQQQTLDLINRWHGKGRLGYSLTPRFALTSTPELLTMVAEVWDHCPDLWLQTHAAENRIGTQMVLKKFPGRSYIDVYDRFRLLRPRSLYAHCIHIDDRDRALLADTGASIAFCPTSNLFLGSGLFDLHAARAAGVKVGLGTDIGAGTSYSLLETLNEAYKVGSLQDHPLSAYRGFYLATLGGAQALALDDKIGNFTPGKEADFVVLDWTATPELTRRTEVATTFTERLFALMTLGDDRAVHSTHIMGQRHHDRSTAPASN